MMTMTHFLATVEFGAHRSLPDLAEDLGKVSGVLLAKEDTGKFDEVPAYIGNVGEIQFTLFGPTEDQEERECILEVSFRTSLSPTQARSASPVFLQSVFGSSKVDSTGHINCSPELADLLMAHGFSDCRTVH